MTQSSEQDLDHVRKYLACARKLYRLLICEDGVESPLFCYFVGAMIGEWAGEGVQIMDEGVMNGDHDTTGESWRAFGLRRAWSISGAQ